MDWQSREDMSFFFSSLDFSGVDYFISFYLFPPLPRLFEMRQEATPTLILS
ncbi:hypothetical protein DGo_CA2153 [Deinococcus gobiensis I-0]|uniref:Uncharacterized protein n=1 Tax=Deinococcus gobiensis (strain DSM 21396 / JCM 16679 / CGMCC 1.7299 / I-0) TaxID=745776 RepID=H8GYN3_DEIGI|nr:hypothetical protein DGo_CA2153 [Deinococcus gobiensis I-0]